MESVILKVVLVLGIIIAGGFLLFFMADILMAIFNGKKDEKIVNENEKEETKKVEKELADQGIDEQVSTALVKGATVEGYAPESVEEEIIAQDEEADEEVEEETEESDEEAVEEAEEPQDRDAYIEARRAALMERLARMNEEGDEDEESEEEEEESEETDEEQAEETESDEDVVDLDEESDEETEEAREQVEEQRAKPENLQAEVAAARQTQVETVKVYLTEEEYESRLALLNERLKLNEKEFRQCKKEYLPLRKVKNTLESDERKLRRKEALVAKQKVVLYGVNNYADIDEEKAKKLAEDLDLLDGLKLSVEHCQEVMTKNQERYPLLERIYNVLADQNAQLKADIERTEQELAELRAKKN